ncbi:MULTISPECIES: DUF4333 domain-containing protein [unclassified Streptomyces]|uniref:DUF4333 domain-containing protein n=1 Tax=Streptomyces sp. NBC_00119 TaxID=2975659 RepID=A0AAU1UK78_9ACTN|nr:MULTISPECIES: DUF4333 domain-containing protein [unclassified Streptomyces]MCX4650022.1 DUF4333 domain-containing protein [Streptomyces sp. NBC_01446]MCX5320761.1 DUF4333 domain-containing protein [Streptomyces sp. NBC_00120]
MADQRNFARTVLAISSAVIACCAVAVTVKVMATDVISVEQTRVLNQDALERQVAEVVLGPKQASVQGVTCPVSVEVKVGNKVDCRVWDGPNQKDVEVEVISDQGELSVESPH